MNRFKIKLALVIYFLVTFLIYAFLLGSALYDVLHVVFYVLAPLAAFVGSLYTLRIYGQKNEHRWTYLFITFGFGSWVLGEILFYLLPMLTGRPAFPSVASIFFIIRYPLIYLGLLAEIRANKMLLRGERVALDFSVFTLIASGVAYLSAFWIYHASNTFIENALVILANLGNMLLIGISLLLINLIRELKGGKLYYSWLCFTIGLVLYLIADIFWGQFFKNYFAATSFYDFIDLIWIGAYLFFAYGLVSVGLNIKEAQKKITELNHAPLGEKL